MNSLFPDPYEDQFEKLSKEKKEKIAKNELQRLRNIARNRKGGSRRCLFFSLFTNFTWSFAKALKDRGTCNRFAWHMQIVFPITCNHSDPRVPRTYQLLVFVRSLILGDTELGLTSVLLSQRKANVFYAILLDKICAPIAYWWSLLKTSMYSWLLFSTFYVQPSLYQRIVFNNTLLIQDLHCFEF